MMMILMTDAHKALAAVLVYIGLAVALIFLGRSYDPDAEQNLISDLHLEYNRNLPEGEKVSISEYKDMLDKEMKE